MKHPLEFVPVDSRKRLFFTFLFLTLILYGVFAVLDQPLRTHTAPNGIVSFELARTSMGAIKVLATWDGRYNPIADYVPIRIYPAPLSAAFGLGLDYLFMPIYALALGFGTLLAAGRHGGRLRSLGAVAGYGALAAPLFDAVENYALFQVLLGNIFSPYPEIAFYCAVIKFGLLIFGLVVAVRAGLSPKK